MYIAELPTTKQNEIKRELEKIGINGIDLQLAMDSKLSDVDYLLKKRLDKWLKVCYSNIVEYCIT